LTDIAIVDIRVLLVFTILMYQTISEPIEVAGIYTKSTFIPKKFRWKNRVYPIQEITLQSDTRDGGVKKRLYSVVVGKELYRLTFNRDAESWLLEEVWIEG
jgi:hypothetical protein